MVVRHRAIGNASRHPAILWEPASQTEREAIADVVAEQLGGFAWQRDDDSIWILTSVSPIVWVPVGSVSSLVSSVNGQTGDVVLTQDSVGDGATYVRTHNDLSDTLLSKLNGIEDGAQVNEVSSVNPPICCSFTFVILFHFCLRN